jgi:transposase
MRYKRPARAVHRHHGQNGARACDRGTTPGETDRDQRLRENGPAGASQPLADAGGQIKEHEAVLEKLVRPQAPALMEAPDGSNGIIAEMLMVLSDNPERIRSEAVSAKFCGVCPVTASSGKTSRHHLNRSGNHRANAALYLVALVSMRHHRPTRDYTQRRTAEGKSPREIWRCQKR